MLLLREFQGLITTKFNQNVISFSVLIIRERSVYNANNTTKKERDDFSVLSTM